jgi:hypothetical protein
LLTRKRSGPRIQAGGWCECLPVDISVSQFKTFPYVLAWMAAPWRPYPLILWQNLRDRCEAV